VGGGLPGLKGVKISRNKFTSDGLFLLPANELTRMHRFKLSSISLNFMCTFIITLMEWPYQILSQN